MGKILADRAQADENALISQLRAELEALKADRARSEKKPGFYEKTVKTTKKDGSPVANPARCHAERILADRSVVSFYVGTNGKLTIGSHYGTYGITAWADDTAYAAYLADTGPDGFMADRERIRKTGHWAMRPAAD
jgi:hypothetical protein